jgi:hypothetical protein
MYFVGYILVLHLRFCRRENLTFHREILSPPKCLKEIIPPENQFHDPDSVRTEILSIFRDDHVSIPCTSPMHW